MTNFSLKEDPEMVSHSSDDRFSNRFPTTFQEKLLTIYWLKKDLENILKCNGKTANNDLAAISQLLTTIEAQIIRILKLASKNDAAFLDYWGFN